MTTRQRFVGRIAGVGSTSGTRVVLGHWHDTPLGSFSDAMVETAAGHRVLLAPSQEVADFIAATYTFDEIRLEDLTVAATHRGDNGGDAWVESWRVRGPSLSLDLTLGRRTTLGRLLAPLPAGLTTAPWFCTVTDPVARVALRGVRTRGSAGHGRREWYGAHDAHHVAAAAGGLGHFEGVDLGDLADVDPPCRFGFSSTPRRPSVTSVVTTVQVPGSPG